MGPSAAPSACSSTSTSPARTRAWPAPCSRSPARAWARICGTRRRSRPTWSSRCPTPGNAAARGLARAAGLPQDDGFIKNRYVARTFIQPGQELRRLGLRLKFNPLPEVVAGKRLIVVDDSIVRGNTTRQIVQMLRDAGAAEIHLRISAPPIKHPCHYGIDMSTREEMIAHGRTQDEVARRARRSTPCTTCRWQGVYDAVGVSRDAHCDACFSGDYPLQGSDEANGKYAFESRCRSSAPSPRAPGRAQGGSAGAARVVNRCPLVMRERARARRPGSVAVRIAVGMLVDRAAPAGVQGVHQHEEISDHEQPEDEGATGEMHNGSCAVALLRRLC